MKRLYIGNAFSLSMLNRDVQQGIYEYPNYPSEPRTPFPCNNPLAFLKKCKDNNVEIISCIGHQDTSNLFSKILEMDLPVNRISVKLNDDEDEILVGQYQGPRLPEGCLELPEGAIIEWWIV